MKDFCLRCNKLKNGVHDVVIMSIPWKLCNKCATKVSNLYQLWKTSKNFKYQTMLVKLMFHAEGFSKDGGDPLPVTFC